MGPGVFFEMLVVCGLRPCARTHLQKALCHTRPVGGTEDKYSAPSSVPQSRVIAFASWTDSHYHTGLSAFYQLSTVQPGSPVSCFCYLNLYFFIKTFVFPVSFFGQHHNS